MSTSDAVDSIAKAANALSAPGKIAYISYVVLTAISIEAGINQEWDIWQFIAVSSIFWLIQMLHDDHTRIWLNRKARMEETSKKFLSLLLAFLPIIILSILFGLAIGRLSL
jgi:hypothetical protein